VLQSVIVRWEHEQNEAFVSLCARQKYLEQAAALKGMLLLLFLKEEKTARCPIR